MQIDPLTHRRPQADSNRARPLAMCWLLGALALSVVGSSDAVGQQPSGSAVAPHAQEVHLADIRQLTFGGENAEGYWSPDGKEIVLQSTHGNYACDQIFRLSPEKPGDLTLVSNGTGRTTCGYFTADGERLVFSSTHLASAECPPRPDRSRGYVWPLYATYEIFTTRLDGSEPVQLTDNDFYDAEATVCPVDGSIIFTSTRDGDIDLYRMNADGSDVRRLTDSPGYDGGAFFSADCTKIVWRASRFMDEKSLADHRALLAEGLVRPSKLEIWIANADGSNARQVTYLDAASFAPYLFPSGERIIFSSNHGDPRGREFDLWAVNTDGTDLERITFTPEFDGFPMFSPDGSQLAFASNRNQSEPGETNLFVARWEAGENRVAARAGAADRFMADVTWLAADERGGRGIGTEGLDAAGRWLADSLEEIGVLPGAGDAMFLQPFLAAVGVTAEAGTSLLVDGEAVPADQFQVSGFSRSAVATADVVFAGHGITSTEDDFDDYEGLDVAGKIALVRRFTPSTGMFADAAVQRRFSALRYKAWNAREHGAVGLLVFDLPEVTVNGELPEEAPLPQLKVDARGDAGIPVAVISRALGQRLVNEPAELTLAVELSTIEKPTANVIGHIAAGGTPRHAGAIVIGAHYDHLGLGGRGSLEPDSEAIHNGADDNASGVAAMLAAGRILQSRRTDLHRDVWLVAFSGEEDGLLGSAQLVRSPPPGLDVEGLAAMINMDMVGWLRDNRLTVLGGDSAEEWDEIVPPVCAGLRVNCVLGGDGYGPSDQTSFYAAGVPVLHLFTGTHHGYHRPSDDAEWINAAGGAQVGALAAAFALAVAARDAPLTYRSVPQPVADADTRSYGASLGTVPDYAGDPEGRRGVLLSGTRAGSAAEAAGIQRGDLLVGLAGHEILDIYDFVYVLRNAKPGETVDIIVVRDNERVTMEVTFGQNSRLR